MKLVAAALSPLAPISLPSQPSQPTQLLQPTIPPPVQASIPPTTQPTIPPLQQPTIPPPPPIQPPALLGAAASIPQPPQIMPPPPLIQPLMPLVAAGSQGPTPAPSTSGAPASAITQLPGNPRGSRSLRDFNPAYIPILGVVGLYFYAFSSMGFVLMCGIAVWFYFNVSNPSRRRRK